DGGSNLGTAQSVSTSGGVTAATFTTSSLSTGSHSITAVYNGNADFSASTSSALTQTVGQPPAITSANNTTFGQGKAGTFTVTAEAPGTTVTIYSDGVQAGGGTAANFANTSIGVTATSALSVGTHLITATATDAFGNVSASSGALSITIVSTITETNIGTASDSSTASSFAVSSVNVAVGNTIFVTVAMDPSSSTSSVTVTDTGSGGSNTY